MKKTNLLFWVLVLLTVSVTTSCSEEGCTDIKATNYDENADDDDGSCVYPPKIAKLKVNINMTGTLEASGCYMTGDVWKIKYTSGPVAIPEKTFIVYVDSSEPDGSVTLDGFTQVGDYHFDIIDNYGDVVEDVTNNFSSYDIENEQTETRSVSISTIDAGC